MAFRQLLSVVCFRMCTTHAPVRTAFEGIVLAGRCTRGQPPTDNGMPPSAGRPRSRDSGRHQKDDGPRMPVFGEPSSPPAPEKNQCRNIVTHLTKGNLDWENGQALRPRTPNNPVRASRQRVAVGATVRRVRQVRCSTSGRQAGPAHWEWPGRAPMEAHRPQARAGMAPKTDRTGRCGPGSRAARDRGGGGIHTNRRSC